MAGDIAITIMEKLIDYTIVPIGRQFDYVFSYKCNITNLQTGVEKLKSDQIDGNQLFYDAWGKDEVKSMCNDLNTWLHDVNEINNDDNVKLVVEDKPIRIACLKGWCPNLITRHQLSRKAKKMTNKIDKLRTGGKQIRSKIRDALNTAKVTELHTDVLITVVSQNQNMISIQAQMASMLGLEFAEIDLGRVGQLCSRLLQGNKQILRTKRARMFRNEINVAKLY
ncbi:hypothetical protein F0562_007269 [Nyssa sinensis]|uniref:Uncharacterized protein n=1 Tax=Nyssa sinensis TaxID=561372 RepID=A0A5J5A3D7_9ASTE|nr:hypothetical protein F0562_007269 [Nyssa sinensis]